MLDTVGTPEPCAFLTFITQGSDRFSGGAGLARDVMGADVAPDQPLMSAGLDSLGAVELRNAVSTRFGITVPATVAFDHPTLQVNALLSVYLEYRVFA